MSEKTHIVWHEHKVQRKRGRVVWFTGLSGCGKSTIANLVDQKLYDAGIASFVLDGDNIRHGLCASPELLRDRGEKYASRFGLGFSAEDREENIRRIGEVAELFAAAGLIALTAFVSPHRRDRDAVRRRIESSGAVGDFVEVFVDTPLAVCEARDPKGLYKKARAGEITNFTGIDAPYEPPRRPELVLDAATLEPAPLADLVVEYLRAPR